MSVEKINLAVFDIDVDSLIKSAQSVKQRIDEIKEEMKSMTKEGKTSSEAFINNAVSLRELNKEYSAQLKVLGEVASANGKVIPMEQQLDKIYSREIKTINDLRKQNSDLLKTRNNLDLSNAEHVKLLDQINAKYDENTKIIKENVSQREQEQMSIGGYSAAIKDAIKETGLFSGSLREVGDIKSSLGPVTRALTEDWSLAVKSLTSATTISGRLTGALKILRMALISTGIGAIVIALGSMVAYLKSTAEGVDRLNKVLVPLRTVMTALLGVVQNVGKALLDAFKNPQEFISSFMEALRPIGTILEGMATFNWEKTKQGFRDVGNAMSGAAESTSKFFGEAWQRGTQLTELTEKIHQSELNLIKNRARLNRGLEESKVKAEDISLSVEERNKNAILSIKYAEELRDTEVGHLDLVLQKRKLELQGKKASKEDELELARIQAERDEAQADHASRMTTLNSTLNSVRGKNFQDETKHQNQAIKKQNDLLSLYEAEQGFKARTLREEIELETELANRRKQILEEELKYKRISQEEYRAEVLKLNNDILRMQAELVAEDAFLQLRAAEDKIAAERNLNAHLTSERLTALEASENELRERRSAYEFIRFNEGLINEREYADAIREINIQSDEALKALRDERKIALELERELDFESQIIALQALNEDILAVEQAQIEIQRERDKQIARDRYTDEAMLAQALLNIDAQANKAQAELAIERDNVILKSKSDLLGSIAGLLGQETLLGKAAAIAQATINTYQGATKALASLPPPASFIAAGASIASGLSSVAKIAGINASISSSIPNAQAKSVPDLLTPVIEAAPPFATGGIVGGGFPIRRSNGDNVLITARTGEVILNERQQGIIGESAFRAAGVPGFATGGIVGSSTAAVQNSFMNSFDEKLVEAISEAVKVGAQQGTERGSQKGISDLSTERHIQNLSTF